MASAVELFLDKHGDKLVRLLQKRLPRTADATGELRKSIRFHVKRFGLRYTFDLYLADYYKWVDQGRGPGKQPPLQNIIKWIKDKRLEVHPKYGLQTARPKSKYPKVSSEEKEAERLARNIARKIGKYGTKGNHFYSDTVPNWIRDLKLDIGAEFSGEVIVDVLTVFPEKTLKIEF